MPSRLRLVESDSMDPAVNLAAEEWLMETLAPDEALLFLWQNQRTVVIGRNQNPYRECPVARLEKEGVALVRRLSGGGAVYHDRGNLNFTFLTPEDHADVPGNMDVVIKALKGLGVTAVFSGRNDLTVGESKISGSAFFSKNGVHCHHGTLLYDVKIDEMVRYLSVSPLKLIDKGIASVRSRVANLKELLPELTLDELKKGLQQSFTEGREQSVQSQWISGKEPALQSLSNKYRSWSWNQGESPAFGLSVEKRGPSGLWALHLEVIDGQIQEARLFTDALLTQSLEEVEAGLKGLALKKEAFEAYFSKIPLDPAIAEGLRACMEDLGS